MKYDSLKMLSRKRFLDQSIIKWDDFLSELKNLRLSKHGWIYRGQKQNWALKSYLERALDDYDICFNRANIEKKMIRDFRRRYRGNDRDLVLKDTLYCLSVMQHYGAPTRLLDWNYSPYIAAFFALEAKAKRGPSNKEDFPVVWCINTDWCIDEVMKKFGECFIKLRNQDDYRNEFSFKRFYIDSNESFVFPENSLLLNERLIIQQGIFLCPGNISQPYLKNIGTNMSTALTKNIIKFKFDMGIPGHKKALKELLRMNIGRDSLFPGLQGFSESFKQRLVIYEELLDGERNL